MAKWIFFGTPIFGHSNPTFPVVAELANRGEEVVYYNSPRFEHAIRAAGAEFRAYRGFPELPESLSRRMLEFVPLLADATEVFLDAEADRLRSEQADYAVHDCIALWGAEGARLLGVPRMAMQPGLIVNDSVAALSRRIMPKDALPGGHTLRLGDAPMLWRVFRQRRRTSRKHGLPYRSLLRLLSSELTIVFTSEAVQPFAEEMRASYRFVGSPTVEREETETFPFEELGDAPLVYVSLGTLFNDKPDFFELCFEALSDLDVHVLLSRGRKGADSAELSPPANFTIRDYVPQLAVLRRAAAFVTHGGVGGSSEALFVGTPQVFLPQIWDGYLMAHQVSEAGAGIALSRKPSVRELREAVRKVLGDPTFRSMSLELGRTLTAAGGAKRAADEMLAWAGACSSRSDSRASLRQ